MMQVVAKWLLTSGAVPVNEGVRSSLHLQMQVLAGCGPGFYHESFPSAKQHDENGKVVMYG